MNSKTPIYKYKLWMLMNVENPYKWPKINGFARGYFTLLKKGPQELQLELLGAHLVILGMSRCHLFWGPKNVMPEVSGVSMTGQDC